MDESHDKELRTETKREEIGQLAKHEPYVNRWDRRFSSSAARGKLGGYVFFKHIRKAGGTTLRAYIRNVFDYHGLSRNVSDLEQIMTNQTNLRNNYDISYAEQEFEPMDWACPVVDPRFQESLNIVVLRHPIERHLSEFFFSGVKPATKKKVFGSGRIIQRDQLFLNKTYTNILARFIEEEVPYWLEYSRINGERNHKDSTMFARWYTDNFQLRGKSLIEVSHCIHRFVTSLQHSQNNRSSFGLLLGKLLEEEGN